jgi:glyoxylase-like metal-dependent hydrolase (beta-lactamase superfamily II)
VLHLPGHSPDAVALLIGNEAILVGDTLLPQITPHPTREAFHDLTREVLPAEFGEAPQIYGLRAYIRSVKRLGDLGRQFPGIPVLPAHRLYYHGQWNHMDLEARAREMLDHHVRRCAEILQIVQVKPRTAEEIAEEHFEPRLLKGMGMRMAVNEVLSHCELLQVAGDVEPVAAGRITATGCNRFESLIDAI